MDFEFLTTEPSPESVALYKEMAAEPETMPLSVHMLVNDAYNSTVEEKIKRIEVWRVGKNEDEFFDQLDQYCRVSGIGANDQLKMINHFAKETL